MRRTAGEPLQYVTGVAGFRRLELAVGPGVFIPRPETELVAERAMQRLPYGGTVVDVGTGSGAIALSIADERPDANVFATEASSEAMSWAVKNRDALGAKVALVKCDLLSGLPHEARGAIDVVVSNPPYIARADAESLPSDVVDHEPAGALFADNGGLSLIDALARQAPASLRPGGWLVLEIGEGQAEVVSSLLRALGYEQVSISRDLNGRNRIAEGRLAGSLVQKGRKPST